MKVVEVCNPAICDNEPHQELIGGKATWYCCFKGFEQSIRDFTKDYAEKYKCHICNDKGVYNGKLCPGECYLRNNNL